MSLIAPTPARTPLQTSRTGRFCPSISQISGRGDAAVPRIDAQESQMQSPWHSELRDGRIYLIKGMLENGYANATAREHLDHLPIRGALRRTRRRSAASFWKNSSRTGVWLQGLLLRVVRKPRLFAPLTALGGRVRCLLPRAERRLLQRPPRLVAHDRPRIALARPCLACRNPEVNAHLADILEARGLEPFALPARGLLRRLGAAPGPPKPRAPPRCSPPSSSASAPSPGAPWTGSPGRRRGHAGRALAGTDRVTPNPGRAGNDISAIGRPPCPGASP